MDGTHTQGRDDVGGSAGGPLTAGLLLAGEVFTAAELRVLAAHGAVEEVLPGVFRAVEGPAGPDKRARALALLCAPVLAAGWTAIGPSAAWVHTGGAPPARLHAAVPHFHRHPAGGPGVPFTLMQSDVAAGPRGPAPAEADVRPVAGVRVTTPARTVEDLLLTGDPDHTRRAARLIARHGAAGLRERLARPSRRPGAVGARRRLAQLLEALEGPARPA